MHCGHSVAVPEDEPLLLSQLVFEEGGEGLNGNGAQVRRGEYEDKDGAESTVGERSKMISALSASRTASKPTGKVNCSP